MSINFELRNLHSLTYDHIELLTDFFAETTKKNLKDHTLNVNDEQDIIEMLNCAQKQKKDHKEINKII